MCVFVGMCIVHYRNMPQPQVKKVRSSFLTLNISGYFCWKHAPCCAAMALHLSAFTVSGMWHMVLELPVGRIHTEESIVDSKLFFSDCCLLCHLSSACIWMVSTLTVRLWMSVCVCFSDWPFYTCQPKQIRCKLATAVAQGTDLQQEQ